MPRLKYLCLSAGSASRKHTEQTFIICFPAEGREAANFIFSRWLSDSIRGCVPWSVWVSVTRNFGCRENWPYLWFFSITAPAHPKYSPCPLINCPCPSVYCPCPPASDCLSAVYPALFLVNSIAFLRSSSHLKWVKSPSSSFDFFLFARFSNPLPPPPHLFSFFLPFLFIISSTGQSGWAAFGCFLYTAVSDWLVWRAFILIFYFLPFLIPKFLYLEGNRL